MNKIIAAVVVVLVVAVAGWYLITTPSVTDYTNTIDTEVSELETELAALDAQVTADTLSESDATAAKVKIVTRLNTINAAATASERAELTPAQRVQLVEGLERLKNILVTYQSTIAVVDANADDTVVEAEVRRRGGSHNSNRSLNQTVADTIDDVEETVVDSVQDYETDEVLDAQVDFAAETSAEADTNTEAETDMTDEETGTTTEETTDSEMDDTESDMGDDMDTMEAEVDADMEASADTDLEANTTN